MNYNTIIKVYYNISFQLVEMLQLLQFYKQKKNHQIII